MDGGQSMLESAELRRIDETGGGWKSSRIDRTAAHEGQAGYFSFWTGLPRTGELCALHEGSGILKLSQPEWEKNLGCVAPEVRLDFAPPEPDASAPHRFRGEWRRCLPMQRRTRRRR